MPILSKGQHTKAALIPMSLIAQLLPLSNVLVDLDAGSKKRVFEQVGLLFENNHDVARGTVFDSLFARERLGSTGLGQGIAIPHGRVKGLEHALGAFLRLKTPIQFDAPDGRPVGLLFVLLVPEQANETHLQLLSELAQMFSDAKFREGLLNSPDAQGIYEAFMAWEASE
jgi:nitrogen PTS system EIIA component